MNFYLHTRSFFYLWVFFCDFRSWINSNHFLVFSVKISDFYPLPFWDHITIWNLSFNIFQQGLNVEDLKSLIFFFISPILILPKVHIKNVINESWITFEKNDTKHVYLGFAIPLIKRVTIKRHSFQVSFL